MKSFIILLVAMLLGIWQSPIVGQSEFSVDDYENFLQQNQDLTYEQLQSQFPLSAPYYKGRQANTDLNRFKYLDSIKIKFALTSEELELLKQNYFVVSERLNYDCFGKAFHQIYANDLPVFISSDAILHALHMSYDQILAALEISVLKPNLIELAENLYASFPALKDKYDSENDLGPALRDVDLYVTIFRSLINGRELSPQFTDQNQVDQIWQAIQDEQVISLPLFSDHYRTLDFSQFKVRGHYTRDELRDYFKAMMWLGRIDFLLTPPPENPYEEPWSKEQIQRMNLGSFLLNELLDRARSRPVLNQNDEIITFMVGESDNLTPREYKELLDSLDLTDVRQLLTDSVYEDYQKALINYPGSDQKILSQIMMVNPFNSEPAPLPVSFRLMGQRFILDSYIFFNVVFDRSVYQGQKIWRPLPDPLDILFVLGNDDALYLLKNEIDQYKYASQLDALRYLVDSYNASFWNLSLYNVWLNSIRALNPPQNQKDRPFFMQSAAWHQSRMNAQLASWAQLRHDNLLYAKQSYTGATGCSYPYSLVEPVPELYARLAGFAEKAENYFADFPENGIEMARIHHFFPKFRDVMQKLEAIARKELQHVPLSEEERQWLKKMLFEGMESGEPPYTGWYSSLYFYPEDAACFNYIIADVHTQPTDFEGNPVGKILHVATGKVNLGVFLANAPDSDALPLAFVGPVMSYYQTVTDNFNRLTDEEWATRVENGRLPERPDWVNIFLSDARGRKYAEGRELPSRSIRELKNRILQSSGNFIYSKTIRIPSVGAPPRWKAPGVR